MNIFGRLKSKFLLLDILSLAFYTPEVETKLKSINKATKKLIDEEPERVRKWSNKLNLLTYEIGDEDN